MKLIEDDILDFLNKVQEGNIDYDVYLAGGYLRDSYYGYINNTLSSPKDVDIILVPNKDFCSKNIYIPPRSFINFDVDATQIKDCRENVLRVIGTLATGLSTSDVQYIIYDHFMTVTELAEDMDCNINQIMFDVYNNRYSMTPEFKLGHSDKYIKMMHSFEEERMLNRMVRMHKKFPEYDLIGYDKSFIEYLAKQKKVSTHAGSFVGD